MAEFIWDFIEEETIKCNVCNKVFNTREITTDDFNMAWDLQVEVDSCSECYDKVKTDAS
jgi:uncharacterized protein (DUF2225 family)